MTRVWAGRQGAAAVAVLAVTALWRGVLVKASYFNQDDYYFTTVAYRRSVLSWQYLFEDTAGHVKPAQQLVYWLVAHHLPFDWNRISMGMLLLELLTLVVLWHVLSRLLPGRWVRIPLLALVAWSPMTLAPTLWWTSAMDLWSPMLFMLLATLFFVRAQQGVGHLGVNIGACVVAVLTGLAWHERGILAVAVLVGVAVARSERTGWRRLTDAASAWWLLWVPLGLVTLGYVALHQALTSVGSQRATIGDRLDIVNAFVFRSVVPGVASGPWQAQILGGAVVAARWVEVVSAAICLAVAIAIARRGGPARWAALMMLGAYVLGDVLLLVLGRAGFGEIIALDPRYTADVVGAVALFAALAIEGPSRVPLSRPHTGQLLALTSTVIYLAASAVTTVHLAPTFQNREDRRFIGNVRSDLAADPGQVLLDRLVPPDILLPLFNRAALLSSVLAPLPEHPVFDAPSRKLSAVTDHGHLVPVRIIPAGGSVPGPDGKCGHAVRTGTTIVPMTWQVPVSGRMVVRLEVFSARSGDYQVRLGDWTTPVHVIPGPQNLWLVVPGAPSQFSEAAITGSGPATLCVLGVLAGPPAEQR